MTSLACMLSLTRTSLAHARLAMLRAAEVLDDDMARGLRVRAESLEDMEFGIAILEAQTVAQRAEVKA